MRVRFKKSKGLFTRAGHCIAVSKLLEYSSLPRDYVLAGLLHDIYEDLEEGVEEIEKKVREAGYAHVLDWVKNYLTEDKNNPDKLGRKLEEFEKLAEQEDYNLIMVAVADKLSSIMLMNSPELESHRDYEKIANGVSRLMKVLGRAFEIDKRFFSAYLRIKEVLIKHYEELKGYSRASDEDFAREVERLCGTKGYSGVGVELS